MGIRWDGSDRRRVADRRRASLRYRLGIVAQALAILVVVWLLVVAASVDFVGQGAVR